MRIAIAQLNPTVGDFFGNLAKIEQALESSAVASPELMVLPELFLTGYPPQDLLERDWFIDAAEHALDRLEGISARYPRTAILVGTIRRTGTIIGKGLHNSAVLVRSGTVQATVHKTLLPTYDVFDEARYFDPAVSSEVIELNGRRLGVTICEDAWNDPSLWRTSIYGADPVAELAAQGASVLINLSASPFYAGKDAVRYHLMSSHAKRHGCPVVLVNQVGGNDELIFDGRSLCVRPDGALAAYLPAFEESVQVIDIGTGVTSTADAAGAASRTGAASPTGAPSPSGAASPSIAFEPDDTIASVCRALVLGLRDYVTKCGFESVLVGLSGGIDSAVVCALAAEAVGPRNVLGVTMPSPYSSEGSVRDSETLASNLGVRLETIPIGDTLAAYRGALRKQLGGEGVTLTEENIQARIRGNILMAISNETGALLLSTGNKSEVAVGYCTLYGDMSGGLSVIADVPKTMVYELARHINEGGETVPQSTIDKPPSAELRPDQLDRDSLPPYDILDEILDLYVDQGASPRDIVSNGIDRETVEWVVAAVNRNEYKRRQAAPGLKVTSKAFGTGRRMPIAAKYDPWSE